MSKTISHESLSSTNEVLASIQANRVNLTVTEKIRVFGTWKVDLRCNITTKQWNGSQEKERKTQNTVGGILHSSVKFVYRYNIWVLILSKNRDKMENSRRSWIVRVSCIRHISPLRQTKRVVELPTLYNDKIGGKRSQTLLMGYGAEPIMTDAHRFLMYKSRTI